MKRNYIRFASICTALASVIYLMLTSSQDSYLIVAILGLMILLALAPSLKKVILSTNGISLEFKDDE